MATYKELDPEVARRAIEGFEDELDAEAKALDEFYSKFKCPRGCYNKLQREIDGRHAFADPGTLVPRSLLRCRTCGYLVEPHSGTILESGNPGKMEVESSPLILPGCKIIGSY